MWTVNSGRAPIFFKKEQLFHQAVFYFFCLYFSLKKVNIEINLSVDGLPGFLGISTSFFFLFFIFSVIWRCLLSGICATRKVSLYLGKKQRGHLEPFSNSTIAFPTLMLSTHTLVLNIFMVHLFLSQKSNTKLPKK